MKTLNIHIYLVCIFLASMGHLCAADTLYASGSYSNVYCELCRNQSREAICSPTHQMSEDIILDYDLISSDGSLVTLQDNSVTYVSYMDFIPMQHLSDASTGKYVDYEYRGKIILFGGEYFVKSIEGYSQVYACRGAQRFNITDAGFSGDYNGYKFKVDYLIYAEESVVAGVVLNVEKPNGSVVDMVQLTRMSNDFVDDLELTLFNASEDGDIKTASLIIYNLSTRVDLEDGEDLVMSGEVKEDWEVKLSIEEQPFTEGMSVQCYDNVTAGQRVLSNVTITYKEQATLADGESLSLPAGYKIVSDGINVSIASADLCSLVGDYPPCGEVTLAEVIDLINQWASGQASLTSVIDLINTWSSA